MRPSLSFALTILCLGCSTPTAPMKATPTPEIGSVGNTSPERCAELVAITCEKTAACLNAQGRLVPPEAVQQCFLDLRRECVYVQGIEQEEYLACGWGILQSPCPETGGSPVLPVECEGIADL